MSTEPIVKWDLPFGEAPASWNTRYITPQGFVCQITLRGESGKDLLEKADTALAFLLEHGYQPDQKPSHDRNADGHVCPLHKCQMRQYEKDGRTWLSHRLPDGSWCRGRKQ